MSCTAFSGEPCRCKRYTGECIRCGREVAVTHGERAPGLSPAYVDEKNRLHGYTCISCRR